MGDISATPVFDAEHRFYGSFGMLTDITERKRAEAEIQRRNRELALLNRIIAASVAETNEVAILEIACRELTVALGFPQAEAILLNEQKTEAVIVAECLAEGRSAGLGHVALVKEIPMFAQLISSKEAVIINDIRSDPRVAAERDFMQQRGMVTLLVVPLIIDEQVIGSLGLDASEPRQFSMEEVALVQRVADQVSGVLARFRLNEAHRRLEAQYHQSQRMEAIGRLTGGVAHDFNNILTVMIGYCDFLLDGLGPGHPLRHEAEQIQRAAERAASLTRQLLAFSRQQVLQPQVLDLNKTVIQVKKMLRRLIGEDIDLVTTLEPRLERIKADSGQLEQVIMNLAVNARDAMPEGGKLTIETANVYLDEGYTRRHGDIMAGPYVMLAVSDTGQGMDAETQAHIFEPFFTTKEQGKGTGLGLATVHGIVNQSGGHIWVYSEPGYGTTFKIYLPQIEASVQPVEPKPASRPSHRGSETILLVEDADTVRELAYRVLLGQGYTVLMAGDSQQARQVCNEYKGAIQLLLTDIVIPGGMNGVQLAQELGMLRPQMKVLYMSGYTDKAIVNNGMLEPDFAFLPKPFAPDDLSRKVREILDS